MEVRNPSYYRSYALSELISVTDTTKKDVGMAWKDVFGKLVKPVVHQWQELPDEKAREQFADQVLDDFYNGNYHLYNVMYFLFEWLTLMVQVLCYRSQATSLNKPSCHVEMRMSNVVVGGVTTIYFLGDVL
jgi:hypothetical protein